jgi:hypothetical protein
VKSEEFIREVDEELQRERAAQFWRRYGGIVVAFAVLLVAVTAGWVLYDRWQQSARVAEALRYAEAEAVLARGDKEAAAAAFAGLAGEASTGYAALAKLREAQAMLDAGDPAAAARAMEGVGSTTGDAILTDLGKLLSAARGLDTSDPAALTAELEPLAAAGSPWRHQARELLAVLSVRSGDLDKARKLLGELSSDIGVPPTMQRRADELLQSIGGQPPKASS